MSGRRRREERLAARGDPYYASRLRRTPSMDVALEVGAVLRQARLDLVCLLDDVSLADARGALPGELDPLEVAGFLRDAVAAKASTFPAALWTWGDPFLARSGLGRQGAVALGPATIYLAVVDRDPRTGEPQLAFGARAVDFGSVPSGFSGFESRVTPFGIRPLRPTMARLRGSHSELPHGHAVLRFDDVDALEDVQDRTRERRESFMSNVAPFLAWARGQVALDAVAAGRELEPVSRDRFAEDVEFLARGRPASGRGSYVVRFDVDAGRRVMDEITAMDPGAEFEQERNPITLWVRTRLVADEIRRAPGVKDAYRSSS